jgi:hypothetical protein
VQLKYGGFHGGAPLLALAYPVRDIPARPEDKAIKARRTINATGAGSLQHGEEHALHEIGGEILAAQVAQAVKPDPRPEAPRRTISSSAIFSTVTNGSVARRETALDPKGAGESEQ